MNSRGPCERCGVDTNRVPLTIDNLVVSWVGSLQGEIMVCVSCRDEIELVWGSATPTDRLSIDEREAIKKWKP